MNTIISRLMLSTGLLLGIAVLNPANAVCTHDGFCDRPI